MLRPSFKTKGFTLIELLLVIVVISLLAIAALNSMMKSQDQFRFKGVVNETANILRTIRNYALSNKPAPIEVAPQYGAVITANGSTNSIMIFGDTNNNNQYDGGTDHPFKTYTVPANSGAYTLMNDKSDTVSTQTMTIFYKPTTANFSIQETYFDQRYAMIKITDSVDTNRVSYIVLFKESGNPEVLSSTDVLQ